MTVPVQTVWPIEPHTAAKHELLRHYLAAWFPILASREARIIFLDGFAGPGIYSDGSPGSPVIALRTLLNHSAFPRYRRCEFIFHFIEKDPSRLDRLQTELQQFDPVPSNVKVATHPGEFQDVIEEVSTSLSSRNRRLAPTLAFVDPFGVSGVPMNLISRFLDSNKCELFLILMANHLNRFLSAEHMRSSRDSLFGTNDFSEIESAPSGEREPLLVDLYKAQLRDVARFQYALDFEMRRVNGTVAYYVVYATRSLTGVEKFKDAMWKVDPSTGSYFSDRNWNQGSLLTGSNVELSQLQQRLGDEFGGQDVSIERLEEFTLVDTPFRKPHLRSALKSMESSGRIVVTRPAGSRRGFPEGTQVRFNRGLGI
ncbi:MAG: three-Cys-motif partner protein TcmP [bacterium]|nr:three-Cys-motif partner protein TcmP [Acidimicrobiaceae bacterium]MCY3633420.1 three-Cys-motif partner protein TcmP [bacterium]